MTEISTNLKKRLRGSKRQLVINIDYTNASLVSFLARELADVIFIDCEQGDTSIESIPDLVRAAHIEDTPCVVREPDRNPETIERYLFRGVDGIVVPRVDTVDQAIGVVDAVDYCMGDKSSSTSVIVQIESQNAASDIDAFLELENIDAFFIGPVDLSRRMGPRGDYSCPAVAGLIDQLVRAISKADRCVGMLCTKESIARLEDAGCSFLYLHTNDFLRHGREHFLRPRSDETQSI